MKAVKDEKDTKISRILVSFALSALFTVFAHQILWQIT
jgi:hypothetical protein